MKTAVEWLAEKYDYAYWMVKRDEISPGLAEEWKKHYLEQAKEMEKEQIEQAYFDGCNYVENGFGENPTDYYKAFSSETIVTEYRDGSIDIETFKSEE